MSELEVPVVTAENKAAGNVTLDPAVFGVTPKPHLYHAEVRRQLAGRRAGTHSTKNRSGVSGGGSKPWRQKGTGRARQGSSRSPQWAGGGTVFGPVPRDHSHALPKKMRAGALRSAVSQRVAESGLTVVESLTLAEAKTRRVVELLAGLDLAQESVLLVTEERDVNLERAARNLPHVDALPVAGLNVYDVLRHQKLVLSKAAVPALEGRLGKARGEVSA